MAHVSSATFMLASDPGNPGYTIPQSPSMYDIQYGFGGVNPASLNEYYAGGPYVPNPPPTSGSQTGPIPTSGTISIGNFRGVTRNVAGPLTLIPPARVYGSQGSGDSAPRSWTWASQLSANKNTDSGAYNSRDMVAQFGATGGTGNYTFSVSAVYFPGETRRYTIDMNYNGFPGLLWIRYDQNRWITATVTVSDGQSTASVNFDLRLWW